MRIRVKNTSIIQIQRIKDRQDGDLFVAELEKNIPFLIKRFFFVNIPNRKGVQRGFPAHKHFRQVVFCLNGSFRLHLDDGKTQQDIMMNDPSRGVLLGTRLWHTMTHFSFPCTLLVLASHLYDEDDYIRDYDVFLRGSL